MKTLATQAWRAASSLRSRVILFLSFAILPIGIIALLQTIAVVREARQSEIREVLQRTAQVASSEGALLQRASGAAFAFGGAAARQGLDLDDCSAIMEDFIARAPIFAFAGFIEADGRMSCTSNGVALDVSDSAFWRNFVERPESVVTVSRQGIASGVSVMITTVPIFAPEDGELLGAAAISIPHSLSDTMLSAQIDDVALALIDGNGTILSASTGMDNIGRFEELSLSPMAMGVPEGGMTFNVVHLDGKQQLAALVPLVAEDVYVLGLWEGRASNYSVALFGSFTFLFPIVIWAISLIVAVLSLDRLVLRHLRELRWRMGSLSFDDPSGGFAILDQPPREFGEIAETYNAMIDRMLADRTELEDNLTEKDVLLREIHHRVRNNLQLIASMLNMQMRSVSDSTTVSVLKRVQDRVMSLSSIHKALYVDDRMVNIRADKLLEDVVTSCISFGLPQITSVRTKTSLAPVVLDPDQAVPLALLTSEVVTNAMKFMGQPEDGSAEISISLTCSPTRDVVLEVRNTNGKPIPDTLVATSTGLGERLMEAFVAQLGGESEVINDATSYTYRASFVAFAVGEDTDD